MTWQQIPNVRVWSQGRDYVESAEILLDYNRIQPATVVSALSIEIFVKSFLAKRLATGHATTEHGHGIVKMFECIALDLQTDLLACSREIDASVTFEEQLKKT